MSSNISFAQNLQSDGGQKAIMFRLESELRILEVLKKFLTIQIRLEKEYTSSLENATSAAMKIISAILTEGSIDTGSVLKAKKCNSANESVISKETFNVLEEVQSSTSVSERNANFLELTTLKGLNELISQKKILLKSAKEEYRKTKGKLDQFADSMKKQKAEYFKYFNSYESARTKFEENCVKGHCKNQKKSEDSRDNFFRMKRRLNMTHAEYLLLLQEAIVYDRDFRTILLPGLLQIEQTWCEKQLIQWNEILEQILNNSAGISPTARLKLKEFEFAKEYTELISQYKCPPLHPMDFKFEAARVSSQPVAQGNLIIESGTVDFFRRKITDIEKRLKIIDSQFVEKNLQCTQIHPKNIMDELKTFDLLSAKCEIDRLKHLKSYIEAHFKGLDSVSQRDETISLISEHSLKKGTGNRFTTFLRNATTLTRKAVSFDSDSGTISHLQSKKLNSFSCSTPEIVPNGPTSCSASMLIAEEDWFHGVLPREDVVRLLKSQGDYLVRETIKNGEQQLVLSALWIGHKHFMIQTTTDGQFRFEGPIFPSVKELLKHYVQAKIPITNRSGAVIVKQVKRENWELNNDDVQLIEKIGRGNFGDVFKASINGLLVAVKTCKIDLPEEQKRKFLQEGRILKQYNHPNIVRFVGICVQKQPIMIVMELVIGGSLLTYLKSKGKSLSIKELTKMCLDTSAGMKYLEDKSCLHRDLAARNCLIDETSSVKISDFGMSREEHEYTVSDGMKQIPIKWTAPEALNYGRYTTLSDVWSYGILIWEIFSRGSTPYPGMTNSRSREMIEAGYRMPAPDGIPDVLYQLMERCWHYESEQRPRFAEIYAELEIISNSDLI